MSYNEVELLKSIEELATVIRQTRTRLLTASDLVDIDYDTISKIFWTDDGGFLDSEYTEAVDFLHWKWSNWCMQSGLVFRRELNGVRVGLLNITDFDNGLEATMSNILSKALADKSDSLKTSDLQDLDKLNLKKLSDDGVDEEVISRAIEYLSDVVNVNINKIFDIQGDIIRETMNTELIDFFKRRLVSSYKFAYDDVIEDIRELTNHEQTRDVASQLFTELHDGNFGSWYNTTIKNKQSLGRILEIAETRNKLQRLLD